MMIEKKIRELKDAAKKGRSIIHFSNLENKIGINPNTSFETPAGVYGYILNKKTLNCVIGNKNLTYFEIFKKCEIASFATRRDFVYVAELKNNSSHKFVIRVNKNGSSNFTKDMYNLKINELKNLSTSGSRLINPNVDLENFSKNIKSLEKDSHIKTLFGYFWNITRSFSRNPIAWGSLLYELGISAVFDYGAGLIHPSEPSQAVIFETHKLNVIYHGKNKLSNNRTKEIVKNIYLKFKDFFKLEERSERLSSYLNKFSLSKDSLLYSNTKKVKLYPYYNVFVDPKKIYFNNINPSIFYIFMDINDSLLWPNGEKCTKPLFVVVSIDLSKKETMFYLFNHTSFRCSEIPYEVKLMDLHENSNYSKIDIDQYHIDLSFSTIDFFDFKPTLIGFYPSLPYDETDLYELKENFVEEISRLKFCPDVTKGEPSKKIISLCSWDIDGINHFKDYSALFRIDIYSNNFGDCRALSYLSCPDLELCCSDSEIIKSSDISFSTKLSNKIIRKVLINRMNKDFKILCLKIFSSLDDATLKKSREENNKCNTYIALEDPEVENKIDNCIEEFLNKYDQGTIMVEL